VVEALRTPEARGGWVHLAPNACRAPMHTSPLAIEWRPAEGAYRLLGRGRKLLHELDRCVIEARIARKRLLLEKPFGHMPWSPRPVACCPLHISQRLRAARSRRRCTTELLRRSRGRRSWRGGYAASNRTQEDLRPAALGKAQPREAPLEVVV
jgi:hypothetical protein